VSQLDKRDKEVLRNALKDRHKNETFERALGRAIRKDRGDFKRYIKVISDVRELAHKKNIGVLEAARIISKD
jgi:hypothetical protein